MNESRPSYFETNAQVARARDLTSPYSGVMEVLLMLPLYSIFMPGTLAYFRGFPTSRKAKAVGYPPRVMSVHVIACFAVIGRYYSRLLFTKPVPDNIDLGLAILQLSTAMYLAKWAKSKNNLYKGSFLIMPFLMTVPITMAHLTNSVEWHRTTVKCVEWFVYFRLVIIAGIKYKAFAQGRLTQEDIVHLVSVPVTLAVADWAMAIPVYFVLLALVIRLNEWVTKQVPHE